MNGTAAHPPLPKHVAWCTARLPARAARVAGFHASVLRVVLGAALCLLLLAAPPTLKKQHSISDNTRTHPPAHHLPLSLCSWYRQAELQNARWAMLGVAGILGQEVLHPEQWWYTAGMPENLPVFDNNKVNLGEWLTSRQLIVAGNRGDWLRRCRSGPPSGHGISAHGTQQG